MRNRTLTLLPQAALPSLPSDGAPAGGDHPEATPLADYRERLTSAKLGLGCGIRRAPWCLCSSDLEHLPHSYTVSNTTCSPLLPLVLLLHSALYSLSPSSISLANPNLLPQASFVTTLTMDCFWGHFTQKSQSQKGILARIPKQSHPDFRKPCQKMISSPNPWYAYWQVPKRTGKDARREEDVVTRPAPPREVSFTVFHSLGRRQPQLSFHLTSTNTSY